MSSENTFDEQKAANLARIRDNQRRSRARRKEYLQELEERYRVCEQLGVEASAEMQAAARRVIEENRRLRLMLKRHGYTDLTIDQAVHDGMSQVTPVAGLEALFGQRKRIPTHTSSSSAASPAVGSSPAHFSAVPGPASVGVPIPYPEDSGLLPSGGSSSSSATQQTAPTPYGAGAQWTTNMFPQAYPVPGAARGMAGAGPSTLPSSHHFGVPSLQTIKTEIGYDPQQEEIDSQNADADYSINDEQYDMMKRY